MFKENSVLDTGMSILQLPFHYQTTASPILQYTCTNYTTISLCQLIMAYCKTGLASVHCTPLQTGTDREMVTDSDYNIEEGSG